MALDPNILNNEFAQLLTGMSEQSLSDEQYQRLTEIISADPEAMDIYLRYTDVESRLKKHYGSVAANQQDQTLAENILLEAIKIEENARKTLETQPRETKQAQSTTRFLHKDNQKLVSQHKHFVIPKAAALASIAALIALSFTFLYQIVVSNNHSTINLPPQISKKDIPVATISEQQDVAWATGSREPFEQDRLHTGEYDLIQGNLQITFDSGAIMLIEAPANFNLTGKNKCIVNNGKVSAHIPKDKPEALGFTILTPDVVAKDMGTEFCMAVGYDGSELHVVDGQVDAQLYDPHNTSSYKRQTKLSLTAGKARAFNGNTKTVTNIKYNDKKFFTRWDDVLAANLEIQGQIEYEREAPKDLSPDAHESDDVMKLILEGSGIVLEDDLLVDMVKPSIYPRDYRIRPGGQTAFKPNTVIQKGTRVTSYLLQLDPIGNPLVNGIKRSGSITFEQPIVGVIMRDEKLVLSDKILGAPNTFYADYSKLTAKEIEQTRGIGPLESDLVDLQFGRRTIHVAWGAGKGGDTIRILVEAQPEKSSGALTPEDGP